MLLRVDGGRSRRPGRGRGGGRSGGGGWGGGRRLVSADIGVDDEMAHGWLMSLIVREPLDRPDHVLLPKEVIHELLFDFSLAVIQRYERSRLRQLACCEDRLKSTWPSDLVDGLIVAAAFRRIDDDCVPIGFLHLAGKVQQQLPPCLLPQVPLKVPADDRPVLHMNYLLPPIHRHPRLLGQEDRPSLGVHELHPEVQVLHQPEHQQVLLLSAVEEVPDRMELLVAVHDVAAHVWRLPVDLLLPLDLLGGSLCCKLQQV
mmetsp:Transcript_7534/g.17115  ORF Transcript_7534/g.17115 Transcript_7534/m.17115 type:complete len:258 (-) Transcript_7534:430-1203(-)